MKVTKENFFDLLSQGAEEAVEHSQGKRKLKESSVTKKVLREYKTHHYEVEYELSSVNYCPACGSADTVFSEAGDGDYYLGPGHVCADCGCDFTIQGPDKDDQGKSTARQIKNGQPDVPTTPRG